MPKSDRRYCLNPVIDGIVMVGTAVLAQFAVLTYCNIKQLNLMSLSHFPLRLSSVLLFLSTLIMMQDFFLVA